MPRRSPWFLLVSSLAILALVAGCSCGRVFKQARQAREAARVARDARDGNFSFETPEGQKVQVETNKEEQSTKVHTNQGTAEAQIGKAQVTEKDLGLAFYPGAEAKNASRVSFGGRKLQTVTLATSGSFDEVVKFYDGKYGGKSVRSDTKDGAKRLCTFVLKGAADKGKTVVIQHEGGEGQVQIVLTAYQD